jgi:hypothetical protein
MGNKIDCAVVRDLLPSYVERLTSEETNRVMEEHFADCEDCTSERDTMMKTIHDTIAITKKNEKVVNYLKKAKILYVLKGIALSMGIIAVFVSFIVDIAVNGRLTWSLIVDAGIAYVYACGLPLVISKSSKIVKMTAAASILLLPFLCVIEYVVNENYVSEPIYWVREYALPIGVLWIVIVWATILIIRFTKVNICTSIGIFLLLVAVGSAVTNAIADQATLKEIYAVGYEWISTAAYLLCAAVFLFLGYEMRKKE